MRKLAFLLLLGFLFINPSFAQGQKPPTSNPSFSGVMYGDAFYNIDQVDSSKKDLNGFQFRRIYFTADYSISEKFDTRFRLEADQTTGTLTPGGKIGVAVKDAYLKWKNIFNGSDFYFGVSPTPAFEVSESFWGYRSLEKTIMDFNGIVSSRDLGVDLKGAITSDNTVRYWVKIGNNSSNAPEVNKYKRYYGMLHFLPMTGLQFTVYGDFASAAEKYDSFDKQDKGNSTFTGALFGGYAQPNQYSVGVELVYKSRANNYRKNPGEALSSQNGFGVSLFGWVAVVPEVRLVARFDTFDPNTDIDKDGSTLVVAGVDFKVDPKVSIIPNLEMLKYQAFDRKDLVGRVTFAYSF